MESISGETEGNTEDLTVRKKSRFMVLKSRLFNRLKKKENEGRMKQSQSTGDVNAQEEGRSEEESEDESLYPEGTLSSRALSHDSIFLADQVQSSEPTRVLSQENVHSKIKALQLKLQQQNMRLVCPPLLIPGKHVEDSGMTSEDDGLPCSPPEMSFQDAPHKAKFPKDKRHLSLLSLTGTGSEEEEQGGFSQPSSRPLSPASPLSPLVLISSPADFSSLSDGVDFTSPAQISILDNSAARHRMSIKPRNQRASTKGKRPLNLRRPKSNSLNNLDQPLSEREETSESVLATQTIDDSSCYSQDASLAEVSLTSTIEFLEQEKVIVLGGGPMSPSKRQSQTIKAAEPLQTEGKIRSKERALHPMHTQFPSVLCDETTAVRTSDLTQDHLLKEAPNDSQHISERTVNVNELFQTATVQVPHSPVNKMAVCDVTKEKKVESGASGRADTKTVGTDVSKSAESLTRSNPIPLLRNKKPTSTTQKDNAPLKTPSLKPSNEKEAAYRVTGGSSRNNDEPERFGSFNLRGASAKYPFKTSYEQKANQEEIYDNIILPRSSSYRQNPPPPVKPVANLKTIDACKSSVSNPDQKIHNSQNEGVAQNASKAEGSTNPEEPQGPPHSKGDRPSDEGEEPEDRNGVFGIKLRSTSLSLRYRSDLASSKDKTKRHSLEVHTSQSVHFEETPISDVEVITTQERSTLQSSDSQEDSTLNKVPGKETSARLFPSSKSEPDGRSEPQWMSIAREKTRVHQSSSKPSAQPALPRNFPSSSTTPSSSTQQLPKPIIQPRLLLPSTSKPQLKTSLTTEPQSVSQPSSQHQPKPSPRMMLERWSASNQRAEQNADEVVDVKEVPTPRVRSTNPTESDQQFQSDRTQPSWMELAKRKSLAWSDKSLD